MINHFQLCSLPLAQLLPLGIARNIAFGEVALARHSPQAVSALAYPQLSTFIFAICSFLLIFAPKY